MKRILYYGSMVVVSLVLGLGSAWWALGRTIGFLRNGPWQYQPLAGSVNADAHLRARVAKIMPFPVNASEAVYFLSGVDDKGNALTCGRDYRIEGRDFDARWWSITCYDKSGYLIRNQPGRYSYNMTNLARNANGTYAIRLSRSEKPGNWLPTGDGKRFHVVLRLYNPAPSIRDHLDTIELPRIIRED